MKPQQQHLPKIDQAQRVFPISPLESNNFLNSNLSQQTPLYGVNNTNCQGEVKDDMTSRSAQRLDKGEKDLGQLIDVKRGKEIESQVSYDTDKNESSFQKKFKNVTWYKLIYLVSEALQRWKSTLNAVRLQNATQNQIEMIDDYSFFQTDWTKQMRIESRPKRSKTIDYNQSKFIRRLKKRTRLIRHFFREGYQKLQELSQILENRLVKILRHIPVFDQYDNIVVAWELLYFVLCVFLYVYLPFSVSFEDERSLIISGVGFYIILLFLSIDFVKTLNTSVYVKGELIKGHLLILKEYCYSLELPLDIFTYFSAIGLLQYNYTRALFMLRIFYKPNLIQKFKDAFQMSEKSIATIDLLKLFWTVLYLCHVVACVWHKIGELEQQEFNGGWIVKNNYQEEDVFTRYVNSYFFSIIMMSSVKGNIQPGTNTEKIFSSLIAFGACVLFGYTITSITIILRNLNTKWDNFNQLVSEITKFMRRYNVDPQQQQKARKYIEYVKEVSLEEKRKSQNVLNCLSKQLKDDIFINIYAQSLFKVPLFKNNFSLECIEQLALKMSASYYASDDLIINRQSIQDPSLYFVIEGEAIEYYYSNFDLPHSDNQKVIREKGKGEVVGLIEFVTQNQKPLCYAKSRGVTELHTLKLKDFLDVIQKFPEEKEHYYHMKDQMMIYKKTKYIEVDCSLCYQKDHIEKECTQTFFEQRRKFKIQKYGIAPGRSKEIQKFDRRMEILRYHPLTNQGKIEHEINFFKEQFVKENYEDQDNHEQMETIFEKEELPPIKKVDSSNINTKRDKSQKREAQIHNLMNQYNHEKLQDQQNEFMMTCLSPTPNDIDENDPMLNMILIEQHDEINLDEDDMNCLQPLSVNRDHLGSDESDNIQKSQKYITNQNSRKSNFAAQPVFEIQEESHLDDQHSNQSITPKNTSKGKPIKAIDTENTTPSYLLKNNYIEERKIQNFTEQSSTSLFVNQFLNNNAKSLDQNKQSQNISNGEEMDRSLRAQAIEFRRNKSFTKKQNQSTVSDDDTQTNYQKTNSIVNQERQYLTPNGRERKKLSIKLSLHQIGDKSILPSDNKLLLSGREIENVSVDYSAIHNYKYYFPHNNFSSLFKPKTTKANQRRSVINPLLLSQKSQKSNNNKDKSYVSMK